MLKMKLSDFDYYLPKELIAQEPLNERDSSRLMVVSRGDGSIRHKTFRDILEYLNPGDILALNDTKVIPARLLGVKKGTLGRVDVLLSNRISSKRFQALIKPRLKIGQEVLFNNGFGKRKPNQGLLASGTVSAVLSEKGILEFNQDISLEVLEKIGVMPLPPYIKRQPQALDNISYQTVYARNAGAIASPTAGRHFTPELLKEIEAKSVDMRYVTLHVGTGTFKPVKSEDIENHQMDQEEFNIPKETLSAIIKAKKEGRRIFAVGTTTTRALETVGKMSDDGRGTTPREQVDEGRKYTGLFIHPGYEFKVVDCLLTNFHLPKTTLLMLACAFAGRDLIMKAYNAAIKEKYRFYSYGDAMLGI